MTFPHTVGVVGAGRVGAVVAARLRSAGYDVIAASARSVGSRTRVETMLPGVAVATPGQVAEQCDLLLLAVPDDALPGLVAELALDGHLHRGQVVVHTSGRYGLGVLAAAAHVGARPVAMHPAMTFTGTDVDLARLDGCVFGLTADGPEQDLAERLVADLGGVAVRIREEDRTTYHAALAHGANHLVTLVTQSMQMLRRVGADDPAAVLRPLLRAALDNALVYEDAALTGPVVRGDVETVRGHVEALAEQPVPTLDAYVAMARATSAHAIADGRLDDRRAKAIRRVLRESEWDVLATLVADEDSRADA
ncbi:putative short-subunit dehydrogenase-like oxidoreductase (DUF2520 family) [Mumia flava]|uniref:Putative short-subunit dehydrogenase-like oxidoreductase (DUF2520 family) n=1 Tax=Mumia flava TaxID=1348852 RepID=A0A2M9BJK6_9ACTN|nr:Rossmann-like and DUF2520 domain-containing protein [Mumia flava]PJJ58126.1 putative short-subunit dehydrogenase-like oxidoreductase (DUF2520 family) [Mumia flava]